MAQLVKNLPAMQETWVGKVPWRSTWQPTAVRLPGESRQTEEPGRLQSMGSQRVGHNGVTKHSAAHSLVNKAVIVSGGHQRNLVIHIHASILPPNLLPSRLPHNVDQSSLCYTA